MWRVRRKGPRTASRRIADANLNCAFVENALVYVVPKIWEARAPLGSPLQPQKNVFYIVTIYTWLTAMSSSLLAISSLSSSKAFSPVSISCFQERAPLSALGSPVYWTMAFRSGSSQVWSLTQFYSVGFLQSIISVKSVSFYKHTITVCVSCYSRCPGTSALSAMHLLVPLYL